MFSSITGIFFSSGGSSLCGFQNVKMRRADQSQDGLDSISDNLLCKSVGIETKGKTVCQTWYFRMIFKHACLINSRFLFKDQDMQLLWEELKVELPPEATALTPAVPVNPANTLPAKVFRFKNILKTVFSDYIKQACLFCSGSIYRE